MTMRGTPAQDGSSNECQPNRCNPPCLEVAYAHTPNRDAMLQALRVVLELPRMPIVLYDENERTEDKSLNDSAQRERPDLAIYAK